MRELKQLNIDRGLFLIAFDRNETYGTDCTADGFIDLHNGDILWIAESDESAEFEGLSADSNKENRTQVEEDPDNYLKIPPRKHVEDIHRVMKEFLVSPWTDQQNEHEHAISVYKTCNSIKFWMRHIDNQKAIDAYFRFRDAAAQREADEFLVKNGIQVTWY